METDRAATVEIQQQGAANPHIEIAVWFHKNFLLVWATASNRRGLEQGTGHSSGWHE